MKMKNCVALVVLAGLFFSIGCKKDPVTPLIPPAPPPVVKGVYVLNEGNFGDATGARLTLYDVERDTAYLDVFESANGNAHLGSLGDDMALWNGKGYVLMSGSENLDVISLTDHTLLQSATYAGSTPHDLLIDTLRNKIYITRLYAASLLVVNLQTLTVQDTIPVGQNPMGMTLIDTRLFVCNSGYGASTTVSVVDVTRDSVVATLGLSDGPSSAELASAGHLWVLCSGNQYAVPATVGKIFIIDPAALTIGDSIVFNGPLAGSMAIASGGDAYVVGITPGNYYGGPIHKVSTSTKVITPDFIPGTYYNLAIDQSYRDIYLADARNFQASGEVLIYGSNGILKNQFTAQRGPSVIRFKW
jgi:YVTN family beta-propeller protein